MRMLSVGFVAPSVLLRPGAFFRMFHPIGADPSFATSMTKLAVLFCLSAISPPIRPAVGVHGVTGWSTSASTSCERSTRNRLARPAVRSVRIRRITTAARGKGIGDDTLVAAGSAVVRCLFSLSMKSTLSIAGLRPRADGSAAVAGIAFPMKRLPVIKTSRSAPAHSAMTRPASQMGSSALTAPLFNDARSDYIPTSGARVPACAMASGYVVLQRRHCPGGIPIPHRFPPQHGCQDGDKRRTYCGSSGRLVPAAPTADARCADGARFNTLALQEAGFCSLVTDGLTAGQDTRTASARHLPAGHADTQR